MEYDLSCIFCVIIRRAKFSRSQRTNHHVHRFDNAKAVNVLCNAPWAVSREYIGTAICAGFLSSHCIDRICSAFDICDWSFDVSSRVRALSALRGPTVCCCSTLANRSEAGLGVALRSCFWAYCTVEGMSLRMSPEWMSLMLFHWNIKCMDS